MAACITAHWTCCGRFVQILGASPWRTQSVCPADPVRPCLPSPTSGPGDSRPVWSGTWGEQAAGPVASVPTAGTSHNPRLTSHAMLTSSYGAGNSIFQCPPSLGPQALSTHRRSQGRESSAVTQRGIVFSGSGRELAARLQGLSAHVCAGARLHRAAVLPPLPVTTTTQGSPPRS